MRNVNVSEMRQLRCRAKTVGDANNKQTRASTLCTPYMSAGRRAIIREQFQLPVMHRVIIVCRVHRHRIGRAGEQFVTNKIKSNTFPPPVVPTHS